MDKMTLVGGICWLINIVLAALFAYDTRKTMTKRGILLKGLSSFGIIAYAVTLIVMWGQTSEGSCLFVIGMVRCSGRYTGGIAPANAGRRERVLTGFPVQ